MLPALQPEVAMLAIVLTVIKVAASAYLIGCCVVGVATET